jgi:hypothetical protein
MTKRVPGISMANDKSSWVLNNVVSPYGLAMISYAFFLFACLIPPSIYSHYMHEPDLMFLDPATILFYTFCVAGFIAGVWFMGYLFPAPLAEHRIQIRSSPAFFLLSPLIFGILATSIAMILLLKQNPNILLLLLAQQGGELKQLYQAESPGKLALVPIMLVAVTWWGFSRSTGFHLRGWRRWLFNFSLGVAVFVIIISAFITLYRYFLMMVLCGLAILYVLNRTARRDISANFFLKTALIGIMAVALLFFATSFARGTVIWDDLLRNIIGYTAASYNRLAAVVNGNLRYPYAGHGIYFNFLLLYSHPVNSIYPFVQVLNLPDFLDVWGSEFQAVSRAGLDGTLIWSGTFGYIFAELGWFSFLLVFAYGMLYSVVWNWMKRGSILGVVLYPWFGYNALIWFGTNGLLDQTAVTLFAVVILLGGYEKFFLNSPKNELSS